MTIAEYRKFTPNTNTELGSLELNLAHMALGMGSELVELHAAIKNKDKINALEECCDIMWYLCNYANYLNLNINEVNKSMKYMHNFEDRIFEIQDITKKFIAYKKPLPTLQIEITLNEIIEGLHYFLNDLHLNLEEGLSRNIKKLQTRFPNKFTTHDALNRDLKTERDILEGN